MLLLSSGELSNFLIYCVFYNIFAMYSISTLFDKKPLALWIEISRLILFLIITLNIPGTIYIVTNNLLYSVTGIVFGSILYLFLFYRLKTATKVKKQ
jgi:hypothetical protein